MTAIPDSSRHARAASLTIRYEITKSYKARLANA